MTTITVSHNITRQEDFEGTPPGTIGSIGGGPSAGASAELFYQGAQALARRIQSTGSEAGFTYTDTAGTVDATASATSVILMKVWVSVFAAINPGGSRFGLGDTTSDYHNYQVGDDGSLGDGQFAYPQQGGWILLPINPNLEAWRNLSTIGTPDLTVVDVYRYTNNVSATSTGVNQALDSIDYGNGWYLKFGSAGVTDDPGVFADFVEADQASGNGSAGRAGLWSTKFGAVFAFGTNVIGRDTADSAASTTFADELQTIIFPGGFVNSGWNNLEIDLACQSDFSITGCTIVGRGRARKQLIFDSELDVTNSGTQDHIGVSLHGLQTGDALRYVNTGGSSIGLTNGSEYYAYVPTVSTFQLFSLCVNAFDNSGALSLLPVDTGNGEGHFFVRQPDTRPDVTVVSGQGGVGSATFTGCVFNNMRRFTANGQTSVLGCTFITSDEFRLISGAATVSDCTFDTPLTPAGSGYMTGSTISYTSGLAGCTFVQGTGSGHAIHTAISAGSVAWAGVTFQGYGVTSQAFDVSNTVDATTDEINLGTANFATGDAVYYNSNGGTTPPNTDNIGLTGDQLYFVRLSGTASYSFFLSPEAAFANTNPVALTAVGASTETHVIYDAGAAYLNSTEGDVTISITGGGDVPTIRNTGAGTTTTVAEVVVTLTGLVTSPTTEVRVYEAGTTTQIAGVEGDASASFAFAGQAAQDVDIRIFNLDYLPADLLGFTIPSTDTSIPVQQVVDRNYENP